MLPIHCPFCKNTLHFDGNRSYVCENNHNFDLSKQGYLNLLPVNKKKSKSPGDDEMMVKARREFLEQGFYDPLMNEIKMVIEGLPQIKRIVCFGFWMWRRLLF